VFTSAVELPPKFFLNNGKALALLLGPVMLISWAISFLLVLFIIGLR
jgi:NhaP-type Na+/H+ or K+/H+ antiporter